MKTTYNVILAVLFSMCCWHAKAEEAVYDMKILFGSKYSAWKEYIKQPSVMEKSADSAYTNNDPFEEIVSLGIPALPYIIEKMEKDTSGHFLIHAVRRITKKKFILKRVEKNKFVCDEFPGMIIERSSLGNQGRTRLWVKWWKEGRKRTPQVFETLYGRWKQLRKEGEIELRAEVMVYNYETKKIEKRIKKTEAGKIYEAMRDLGIAALPCMIEKVKQGEYDLLPLVWELADRPYPSVPEPAAQAKICMEWWSKDSNKWVLPE